MALVHRNFSVNSILFLPSQSVASLENTFVSSGLFSLDHLLSFLDFVLVAAVSRCGGGGCEL